MAQWKLSKEDEIKLLRSERELHDLLPELDKAESCGVDCDAKRAAVHDLLEKIANVKQHYGTKSHQMV